MNRQFTSPAPHAQPRTSRWVLAAAAGLLLVVLFAPAILRAAWTSGGDDAADTFRVARLPTDVAFAGGTVWVASGRDDRILAVDAPSTDATPARHETGSAPLRVAVGAGSVWTANAGDDSVTRLNPLVPDSVGRRIPIGADAVDVAVGPDGAWVSNGQRGTVMRINPICNRPLGPADPHRRLPDRARARSELPRGWSTRATARSPASTRGRTSSSAAGSPSAATRRTSRSASARSGSPTAATAPSPGSTPPTGRAGTPIPAGGAPAALAVTRDAVLVLDTEQRRRPRDGARLAHDQGLLRIRGFPASIAVGDGAAWVVDSRAGTVTRIAG